MHETAAEAARAERTTAAASCEYRHFGDDSALLIVAVHAHAGALPGDARLVLPAGGEVEACAVTFQPEAGLARLVFPVERGVASAAGNALRVSIGHELLIAVPEPVKRGAVGVPDAELDHAVAAGVAGDELAGLIRVLERRATIAERVASDFREERSDATKLAQSYREIWEVRELLESREAAYERSAQAIDAAEAAQREAEQASAEAQAELADVRAESQAATARLERTAADQAEAIENLNGELDGATARGDELATERDEARSEIERIEAERETARAEAERLAAERNEARAEAERLEAERDTARAEAERLNGEHGEAIERLRAEHADVTERQSREHADAVQRFEADLTAGAEAATQLEADVDAALTVAEEAQAERDAALTRLEALEQDLAEASANIATWAAELDEARTRAADAEALLEAERTLHEARLASRPGEERQVAELLAHAQRERLRQIPVDDQRAQVQALERQLQRMKQSTPGANG